MTNNASNIVSVEWLYQHLQDPNLIILDSTMQRMPGGVPIGPPPVYIKGAQEFNFDTEVCDQNSDLPHMLPPVDEFELAARKRGINNNSLIVVYYSTGILSSPRVWWMFKAMGHDNVVILDGGLSKWRAAGYPTQEAFSKPQQEGNFTASFRPELVYSAEQVLASIKDPKIQVIDTRPRGRFNAQEPEPRKESRSGHIPGAVCLPFTELLQNNLFKEKQQIAGQFQAIVNKETEKLVFSCGSGITACVLALAADECGYGNIAVYDGSWSEWGSRKDLPIE